MIHYIRGRITMEVDGGLVVETGGIGYRVLVASNSSLFLEAGKDSVLVYTAMIVREDDMSLYGFDNARSLEMFRTLRTVNGVGAKAAMAILSAIPLDLLVKAIVYEDVATLTRANGVGKKTAQRIVLELKDKITDDLPLSGSEDSSFRGNKNEAIDALVQLGYSKTEAASAVSAIDDSTLATEEYVKRALRGIS